MKLLPNLFIYLSFFLVIFLSVSVYAGEWNTNKNGIVLDSYDVVSYQTEDKAVKGFARHQAEYDGVKFNFSTAENLQMFVDNPSKFAPKYNAFCAFAVGAKNAKVPANPDSFKMYNGELLVFFNDLYEGDKFNTKIPWNSNEADFYAKSETNWITLK